MKSNMNLPQQSTGNALSEAELFKLLDRFAEGWNRHDLDALMSLMTDDCVFEASAGPQVDGQWSEGKQAVRAAYAAVFEAFPDAHWANPTHFIAGNRGVSEWTFTGTQKDGKRVEGPAAISSPFATARSPSRTRTARIAQRFDFSPVHS